MTLRESGFQQIFTVKSGILNPTNDRNQESKFHSQRPAIQYLDSEIQNSRLSWIPLKPGSHMPPMHLRHGRRYCLAYCSDMRIEVAGNIGHPSVYRRMFSFVREEAQAVPAATSQIHRRHMRTRRYIGRKGGNLASFQYLRIQC